MQRDATLNIEGCAGTQLVRCQYLSFCTCKASTFVLVKQVYLATFS